MTKIVEVDFRHRAKAKASIEQTASAINYMMAERAKKALDARARERQTKIVLEQIEVAFRNAYHVLGPEKARSEIQSVQSKVDLDYGVVRIL